MKNGYRFIEHTADVGIAVASPTLEGLYELAGRALFDLIAPKTSRAMVPFVVETEGTEPESLLVNFLNDLILHFEVERLLFRRLKTRSLEGGRLVVDAVCEPMDRSGSSVDTVVKAATHHNLSVRREGDVWRAEVYLDL